MSTSERVKGHSLVGEGMAFNAAGERAWRSLSTGGDGSGKCSCGALSPSLTSSTRRKAWHREHKADVADRTDPTATAAGDEGGERGPVVHTNATESDAGTEVGPAATDDATGPQTGGTA